MGAITRGVGEDPPVVGAGRRRAPAWGTARPMKTIGPQAAVAAPHRSATVTNRSPRGSAATSLPERDGDVVPEGESVQRAARAERHHDRRSPMNGRVCQSTGQVAPGQRADLPEPQLVERVHVGHARVA